MRRSSILSMSCGVAALVLAGCAGGNSRNGSSSPESSSPKEQPATAASNNVKVNRANPCSVLLPTEVEEILGVPSDMREITDEVTCHYHFDPGSKAKAESPGKETFIEVKIHWTGGRTAITAARLAGKLLDPGAGAFEKLSGVGDEAWLAPSASYLAFTKGPVGVEIDMRMMPDQREKAIHLAQRIASRL